jgi:hypothetical protein
MSTTDDFCNRADSCNFLATSVDECVNTLDAVLNPLPDADREQVERQLQGCIDLPTCSEFSSCVFALRTSSDNAAQPRASDLLEIE